MYSIVLATMLTTGVAAPDWGRGCCGGCCGGCWGCCGGCYGCWGCCGGCWGGCYGCCGGCYGCWGGCYGCWGGCYGCYGGLAYAAPGVVAPAPGAPVAPVLPPAAKKEEKKSSYLGNAAAVIVKAPTDVQLSVEDRILPRTAGEQTFHTPELTPGYVYTYTFKANVVREGRTVAYTKQVKVSAGQTLTADFSKWAAEGKDSARVTVKLPSDAQLYVDGVLCPLTSTTRSFDTPELDAGRRYYYTLKAEVVRDGVTQSARKRVVVEAGKEVTVEFSDLPVQTVSR
jgi:uncharacterized protein (TIGR03000 family)